ncbi:MAG: Glu-tRNA(Gln) amidotransferase subunit GatE [Candidatus Aenigmarchaeota archaeon]|nr:Glu-tRNA(Gln) amidotransferase subunit GatE [Candidatus Aenigmarchaeota archaeon]
MDYKKLGFKCGLEIHQQLQTKEKLFCSCRSQLAPKNSPFLEIKRKLRPVAGETGEIDIAALHETFKSKDFIYRSYQNESCAVELDSEPIHLVNTEALYIALTIAKMFNCETPDEIQVMRKIVLDGSAVSSFQRTMLVGLNGYIETGFGKVGIENVYLEEDACQIIKKEKHKVIYGLDRLGIPLVEIGTTPNIPNPEQAKIVAEKIGMILRSTEKVKKGLGTIRQDLNVSIKGGNRIEIKGVQKLNNIQKLLENEVKRQEKMILKGKKVTMDVRKAVNNKTKFLRPIPGAFRLYPETDSITIQITNEMLSKIKIPEIIEDKIERIKKKYKINDEIAKQIVKEGKTALFEILVKDFEIKLISATLTSYMKETDVSQKQVQDIFSLLKKNKINDPSKESVKELLESKDPGAIVDKLKSGEDIDIEKIVEKVINENPSVTKTGRPENALMGLVMKETRGKIPGSTVMRIIQKKLKK